jgi:hypothetical protein
VYKQIIFIAVALSTSMSCKKDSANLSTAGILTKYAWSEFKIHETTYRANGASQTLLADTIYYTAGCIQNSNFNFLPDSLFTYTSACGSAIYPNGKWYLENEKKLFSAVRGTDISGQAYYFGITGFIDEITDRHLIVRNQYIYNYISCDNMGNCGLRKDSIIRTVTYKNRQR